MTKKEASDKQEKMIAKYLGWSQVKGSGSRPTHVGDIQSEEWLGECKTHVTSGHKIHFDKKVWVKILNEASSKFKKAAYFVDDGSQDVNNTYVVFNTCHLACTGLDQSSDNINFDSLSSDDVYKAMLDSYSVSLCKLSKFKEIFWSC